MRIPLWFCLFLVPMCLPGCARRHFDTVCQLAKDILAEPRVRPEQRLVRFERQIDHLATGLALDAARVALRAPAGKRYSTFVQLAQERMPGWTCASLKHVLEPPIVTD